MLAALALPAAAAGVDVYVFWRAGCPHCEREIAFLDRLSAANPEVRAHKLEVSRSRANAALMIETAERLGVEAGSVPLTVIGERAWVGYLDDASTGREIAARIDECLARGCPDAVPLTPKREPKVPETLRLPLIGEVRTANLSLPALTALLAAVDGFNPCAMWVLIFLLGLLAGMKDRRRMWVLGGAFVVALKTLEASGLTTRYARWSNAIGGAALLAIGAALVFRPDWLVFG